MLLVVLIHSALAYTRLDIPGLLWGVRQPSGHIGFDVFAWWSMGVSMPLFFALSGFLAAQVESARGPRAYLLGRSRRIVVPMIVLGPILLVLCFCAWALGWLATGRCRWGEISRMVYLDPAIERELYGPAHLWFLEYLTPMLLVFGVFRLIRPSRRNCDPGRPPTLPWWAPLALAIPTAGLLAVARALGMGDLPLDRHNSFAPDPVRVLHYAAFFGFGIALFRARGSLGALGRRSGPTLLAAGLASLARVGLLPLDWSGRGGAWVGPALIASTALAAWLTLFGLIGLARQYLARPSRAVGFVAEASFWVYLVHLPLVGLIQADLVPLAWPTEAKFAATAALTLALGLGSYPVLVRRTFLGWILGARRSATKRSGSAGPAPRLIADQPAKVNSPA